ncbi:hypothetical protein IW145_002372 [Coemansia sp. RSA 521]|nr:hypothetical protein GGH15_003820 [Coemansia sp. RSA 562]KAJ2185786.1 hypothetical protein EV181_003683 [Coemansia sp. RSA 532]KAJ2206085.1 hypothetical protein IW145_002372 [Coemansia sp. RSA 521]KAJ2271147.1 hypothetical protein J3F81_003591 [Coemansia sp. RSA 371]
MIKSRYLTARMAAALQVYHHIAVHTDGSLVTTDVPQPSMGFGGMFQCTTIPFVSEFYSFSGATFDGPVSSTMAEFLALVVVAVLVPDRKCATVFCDSQAAIGLMNQVLDNHPNHQWERSNFAYIASWAVSWLKSKQLNLDLHWVKGHVGNLGNEEADRLAGMAHQSRNPRWSLQLGPPPGLLHWVCVDRQPSQKRTGRLIREQEESWMAERLLAQIKSAHPGADMCKESLQLTLEAVNWFDDGNGHYQRKNTHITTTSYDSNVHSMTLGIMVKMLPTVARNKAWWPLAYPEPDMNLCAACLRNGSRVVEHQSHFMECPSLLATGRVPARQSHQNQLAQSVICSNVEFLGITTTLMLDAHHAVDLDWLRTTAPVDMSTAYRNALMSITELKSSRQRAWVLCKWIHREQVNRYAVRWRERNDFQIQ